MGHGPQLVPDWTLFIQVVLFFISFLALRFLVFKPYVQLLKLRQSKTVGLRERAAEARARAEKLRIDYEAMMLEERRKSALWTDAERRKVAESERDIIQAARNTAGDELQAARKKTDDELKEAQRALSPLAVEFSSAIASKLLGYKVKVSGKAADSAKSAETETVLS
jgi:F0F1-type ATP synthase membrane subunit b/b'